MFPITTIRRPSKTLIALLASSFLNTVLFGSILLSQEPIEQAQLNSVTRIDAPEAFQAAAVSSDSIYAIGSQQIGRYDKLTHKRLATWLAPENSLVKHLNSGMIREGRLYCANSNWPKSPLVNTMEIYDAATLEPLGQRRFEVSDGAINWIDWHEKSWWIVFAYYGDNEVRKTYLVRYDAEWNELGKWTFPEEVIARFLPNSNSGGSFGPDGKLYVTGHDHQELYVLDVPDKNEELVYLRTIPVPMEGQGIAWDRSSTGKLYGISRKSKQLLEAEPLRASEDNSP